jgi:mannitol-specific phosphotransferase system IIBC component
MSGQSFFSDTRMGTAGGTITILLLNINSGDIYRTIVLAAIGATVSFVVAQLLKKIAVWLKSRRQ